ncbi:hypothetical protein SAMN05216464_103458 [Mucilaginibacter pineti]|uniref:MG2 domain-containing protein n=1 Tax=Mucilaginibacter pineti TaxID=1391627 RepID=A0A1G6ZT11_9SPHI|nr:hypothetical protein [Mucilaginibacter pineti]SDE04955.1 hypothetical protein SAMN05216464_103458 [Mucilaginibacter pineti]
MQHIIKKIALAVVFTIATSLCCSKLKAQNVPAIFLHTDKGAYFPGDTIWFKGYILKKGLLDSTVQNLYIDWGTASDSVIQHNVYIVSGGVAPCQFVIPSNYTNLALNLNAYTAAIAGQQELAYFKSIPILQKVSSLQKPAANNYFLSIYPEGGVFLSGVNNRLIFRSYDSSGQPIEISGKIVDANEKEVMTFSSEGKGLAELRIMGVDQQLTVIWHGPDGRELRNRIPPVQKQGVKLGIWELQDTINISLFALSGKRDPQTYTLDCRLNRAQVFKQNISLQSGQRNEIKLPKHDLEAGVLQFTVLDQQGTKLATTALMTGEEVKLLEPEIEFKEISKLAKGRNSFSVHLPQGEEANMSVSITDIEVPVDSTHTIVDAALFGSMSVHRITNPYTYFSNSKTLDRFVQINEWQSDFTASDNLPDLKDSLLYLKGTILMKDKEMEQMNKRLAKLKAQRMKDNKPVRGASFGYRAIADSVMRYQEIFPDEKGSFQLKGLYFFDSLLVRLTQVEQDIKFMPFKVNYSFSPISKPERLYSPALADDRSPGSGFYDQLLNYNPQFYKDGLGVMRLKDVNIQGTRLSPRLRRMDKFYAKGWYSRQGILSLDVQSDPNLVNIYSMEDYLRYLYIKYPILNKIRAVYSVNNFFNVLLPEDISQIAYIKVFDTFPENPKAGGVIAFYTTGPDGANRDLGRIIDIQTVGGYVNIKPYQYRTYKTDEKNELDDYDNRQTLYWNPLFIVKNKPDQIEFYNNNKPRGYRITIQGVSKTGKLIYYQKTIK